MAYKAVEEPARSSLVGEPQSYRVIRTTLPTLQELNLATAIPERVIKKIIKRLRPKKGEIIKAVRNKFSKLGAIPLRLANRLQNRTPRSASRIRLL
jgi:hypothetical protein